MAIDASENVMSQSTAPIQEAPSDGARSRDRSSRRRSTDVAILELASGQHGVVARRQLVKRGVALHAVEYRVTIGTLRPIFRGIYVVGPLVPSRAGELAAVLACGDDAWLSDQSAGAHWEVRLPRRQGEPIEVTVRTGDGIRDARVRVHRRRAVGDDELTVRDRVPITTPARTLLDLAACLGPRELERALAAADRQSLADPGAIERLLTRHPRHRGTPRLRALLEAGAPLLLTRSEAEEFFLTLLRKARLPLPELNVRICGYEVDCLWRRERLVVEIDGLTFHASPRALVHDRRRDQVLTAAGLRVMRITLHDLTDEPEATLVRIAQALAHGEGASSPAVTR